MTISLGGYTFAPLHQMPAEGDWEYEPFNTSFYGVKGSLELRDAEHGRDIQIECTFTGYSTPALLQTATELVDSKKGVLNDSTLTVVIGASTLTYRHCSFRGFMPRSIAMYDGSGVNGWRRDGVLLFRQLQRTA